MTEIIGGVLGAFGLSASAGLNAYIPLLVVSLLARFTNLIELAEPWNTLESWWVIGVLAVLGTVEMVADKVPAVDDVNDAIQTFIRPVAGAILFATSAKTITDVSPVLAMVCGLLVAGSVHAAKSLVARPMIEVSTPSCKVRLISLAALTRPKDLFRLTIFKISKAIASPHRFRGVVPRFGFLVIK